MFTIVTCGLTRAQKIKTLGCSSASLVDGCPVEELLEQGREQWSFSWINVTLLEGKENTAFIMSRRASCTIYVGNLPGDVREREIEDLFHKYGPIVDIDLKLPPRPPGYCFVEFEDPRDADDAIRGRDGYNFDGHHLRVELAHGGRGRPPSFECYSSYSSSSGRAGVSRRSEYRVIVSGLPSSASWQDLKDHMRRAGDVCFAQVFREGRGTMGIIDYTNYEDMKYAIRKLDDSEFRNPFSRSYIRVREDRRQGSYRSHSRSLSRSYSRSGSLSYSRTRSRSRYSSLPRSQSRSCSLSRARSYDRSVSPRSRPRSYDRSVSPRSRSRSLPGSRSLSRSPPVKHSRRYSHSWSRSKSYSRSHSPSRSPSPGKVARRSYSTASEDD